MADSVYLHTLAISPSKPSGQFALPSGWMYRKGTEHNLENKKIPQLHTLNYSLYINWSIEGHIFTNLYVG